MSGDLQVYDPRDEEIATLKEEIERLHDQLAQASREVTKARTEATRSFSALRKTLNPLYRALQMVFGELDTAGVADEADGRSSGSDPYWAEWKQRLGPSCAKVIDALLLGGEMSVEAIRIAAKMGQQTVYDSTSKMGRAGILSKNGGKFSLKRP